MRKNLCALFLLAALILSSAWPIMAQVSVRGYTRRDGTYVQPHVRTTPDSSLSNNYSYPGNYNPNTGRVTPEPRYNDFSSRPSSNPYGLSTSPLYTPRR